VNPHGLTDEMVWNQQVIFNSSQSHFVCIPKMLILKDCLRMEGWTCAKFNCKDLHVKYSGIMTLAVD
jgi:hypothetical protein